MTLLGIDIGGSGIKGGLVDAENGRLLTERTRLDTPQPATPKAVGDTVATLAQRIGGEGPIGVAFPARIRRGVALTATNIDRAFLGTDVDALLTEATGRPVSVLNDADAAGLAEVRFGAARDARGVVMMLTFGTGIGSALFIDGQLVPNTELGHLVLPSGKVAEPYAADRARKDKKLSWEEWAGRVQVYLDHVEFLFAPDLIVVGGGVSKPDRWKEFASFLKTQARLVPAALRNEAGIVGAAAFARERDSM
ncbi:MAG TPA: ROK family protein [Rhodothermales bacterium]|nr:ROK family protein [Rhodothermales bacterium]